MFQDQLKWQMAGLLLIRPRVFPRRFTDGGVTNKLLFENNRILFSLLFSGNFCGRGQGLDGGGHSRDGFSSPPLRKTLRPLVI